MQFVASESEPFVPSPADAGGAMNTLAEVGVEARLAPTPLTTKIRNSASAPIATFTILRILSKRVTLDSSGSWAAARPNTLEPYWSAAANSLAVRPVRRC